MKRKNFGIWTVSNFGIECKKECYYIDVHRLLDRGGGDRDGLPDWLFHMAEKNWSDFGNFVKAFVYALNNHPVVLKSTKQFDDESLEKAIEKTLIEHYSLENIAYNENDRPKGFQFVCMADLLDG